MNENPMDQLSVLQEKLRVVADALGLDLQAFVAIPAGEHGPHMAQAHFVLDPAKAFKSPEERATDDELKRMELAMRAESQEEEANEARRKLQEQMAEFTKGDGIGLDDEEEEPEVSATDALAEFTDGLREAGETVLSPEEAREIFFPKPDMGDGGIGLD